MLLCFVMTASCIDPQAAMQILNSLPQYMRRASWHGTGTLLLILLSLCDAGLSIGSQASMHLHS